MSLADLQSAIEHEVSEVLYDPLAFAQRFYPWGRAPLEGSTGPREWQAKVLSCIRDHLQSPNRYMPLRVAVSSGHGIGKSAFMGMVNNWAMSVVPDAKILVTAGTGSQLATKTVPEISKWFKTSLNASWFDVRATSIRSKVPEHELSWRTDFETWSERNTQAFAGLHNEPRLILVIYDEASAIADPVWEVTEGALTDENTIIIWLAFGNPTENTGRFRECFGSLKHRWQTFQIDSRTVEGTNKAQIAQWIEDYGEDSDFVRVRVRGEFPRAGSRQFIPSDIVEAARKYHAESYAHLPKILSVDVARFGDDQTVIGSRQGRKATIYQKIRGLNTIQVGQRVIQAIKEESPDATVIDADGVGAGTFDYVRACGYGERLFEFHGGGSPDDPAAYYNRRAEVWGHMRQWLQSGAEIPDDPELATDLTSVEYGFSSKQQIQLERKEDMKKRGLASPDCGDMLAMTFSVDVAAPPRAPEPRMWSPGTMSNSWMGD